MKCEIVDVNFNHPSFNWGNGRYVIVNENYDDTGIEICRFDNNKPELYDDGRFMTSVTSKTNPGVKRTGNFYYHIDMKERKKKLERICNEN